MPFRFRLQRVVAASCFALLSGACSDKSPVDPGVLTESPPAALIVSDPFLPSQPLSATGQPDFVRASVGLDLGEVTYVSLPPGSVPNAITVTIRNVTTDGPQTASVSFVDGGFDPTPVAAKAGDELELRIARGSDPTILYRIAVPKRRPPAVVRTSPPKGMVDVALNSRVLVVFTEPVAPATLTTATVQLLQGTTAVPGTVRLVAGNLFEAEFVPDDALAKGSTYRLVVTQGVLDADGDPLETAVTTLFTTAATVFNAQIVFSSIGRAPNHTCGIEAETGLAYCWGDTHAGALGIGDLTDYGSAWDFPALVDDGARRFSSISVSSYNTCGIEKSTSLAYCWGYNDRGQLGNGSTAVGWIPMLVGNGSIRFSSISAGVDVTCGIEAQSALGYCWGKGGLIGDGTLLQRSTPTLVGAGLIRFSSISASESHVCGIEIVTGFAYCWGSSGGELGDGTTSERLLPTVVDGGRSFSSINTEFHLTCAIQKGTALAYCWGRNGFGQVGDGTTTDRGVPTLVGGGRSFTRIDAGGEIACAVETQTNAGYCWGRNNLGQLGDGTTADRLLPTLVGGGTPRFSSISATSWYQCGVEAETGFGYCWGGGFECSADCSVVGHATPALIPPPRIRAPVMGSLSR